MCVVWYIYIYIYLYLYLYIYIYVDIDWSPSCCKSAFFSANLEVSGEGRSFGRDLGSICTLLFGTFAHQGSGEKFWLCDGSMIFFWRSCHVLFYAWKDDDSPLVWKKKSTLYHEGDKSKVFFLLFSLIIVEILAVHGKDCTEREINAVDSEFQAGAMTCGKWFVVSVCLRCSRDPVFQKALFSYVNFVNF